MTLENRPNGCQDLAVIQENLMVNALLGRTRILFVETYVLQQIAFCASILSGLCWTVLDILQRKMRYIAQNALCYSAKLINHVCQIIRG